VGRRPDRALGLTHVLALALALATRRVLPKTATPVYRM
jgi:hypothetical protein